MRAGRIGVVVAVALLSIGTAVAEPGDVDHGTLSIFGDLLSRTFHLPSNHEAAAFVIRTPDDEIRCLPWPEATYPRVSMFRGKVPEGAIAIAHTHPEHSRRPSAQDVAMAIRSGLDVYVVTRNEVWMVSAAGDGIRRVVRDSGWSRKASGHPCRQASVSWGDVN